jgi:integrase
MYFKWRPDARLKFSTGWKIPANCWDRRKQRAIHSKKFSDSSYLNAYLNKLDELTCQVYNTFGPSIEVDQFRKQLNILLGKAEPDTVGSEPIKPTLLAFVRSEYQRMSNDGVKPQTLSIYQSTINKIASYEQETKKVLTFDDLGEAFYKGFVKHLYDSGSSMNYAKGIFAKFKTFLIKAENRGFHSDKMYREVKPKSSPVTKVVLNFDQLEVLSSLSLDARLSKTRDLFLIGAYTGLRFSDFTRIKPENMQNRDGKLFIEITAQKTAQKIVIPCHPILEPILAKYKHKITFFRLPVFNREIREVGRIAGFDESVILTKSIGGKITESIVPFYSRMTSHVARRSFATNYYLKYPELINNIMKITGHTTEQMFRKYIVTDALESGQAFADAIRRK